MKRRVTKSKKKIVFMILLGINLVLLSAVFLQLGLQKPYITDEKLMEYFEITKDSSDISQYMETSSKEEHVELSDSAKQLLIENGFMEEEINEIGHLVYTGADLEFLEEILSTNYAKAFQRKPRTLSTGMTFFLVSYLEKLTGSAKGEEVNAFYNALLSGGANLEEDISYYQTARRARQYLQWLECGAEAKLILNGNKMKLAVKEENKEATETLYYLQGGYYKDYCMSRALLCMNIFYWKYLDQMDWKMVLYQVEIKKGFQDSDELYEFAVNVYNKKKEILFLENFYFDLQDIPYIQTDIFDEIERTESGKLPYNFFYQAIIVKAKGNFTERILLTYDYYIPSAQLRLALFDAKGFIPVLTEEEQKACLELVKELQDENLKETDEEMFEVLELNRFTTEPKRDLLVKMLQGGYQVEGDIDHILESIDAIDTINMLLEMKLNKSGINIKEEYRDYVIEDYQL